MSASTTSAEFFDAKYRKDEDPWNFAGSEYEVFRYETTIAALDSGLYGRAFEAGCSVGELTWRLAGRCARVEAMDISATAVARAKLRCLGLPNVTFRVGGLPEQMPEGGFDLVVFSEIGYYFDEGSLLQLGQELGKRIQPSGTLLAVHWLGASKDHVLSGDRVHEILGSLRGMKLTRQERYEQFRLDRWEKL